LSDDSPENFLANGVEYLLLIVLSQELMDVREFISDRLLEDTKGDAYSLQILSTSSDMDINRLQASIVNDGILNDRGCTSMKGILR
jgi:hypothetical protein